MTCSRLAISNKAAIQLATTDDGWLSAAALSCLTRLEANDHGYSGRYIRIRPQVCCTAYRVFSPYTGSSSYSQHVNTKIARKNIYDGVAS